MKIQGDTAGAFCMIRELRTLLVGSPLLAEENKIKPLAPMVHLSV